MLGKIVVLYAALCYGQAASTNRIIHGNFSTLSPYEISLQMISQIGTATLGHRCGGVLITYQHALTAASCTYNVVNNAIVPIVASDLRVFSGALSLNQSANPDLIRNVANYTVHPQHLRPPSSLNDIAVVTTVTAFPDTFVRPLALPTADFSPDEFTSCTVSGFGSASISSAVPTALKYIEKYIYNQATCSNVYSLVATSPNVFSSMICAASYDIISNSCAGDIGNGLVCNGQLTGILFYGNSCTESSYPELYTRVSNYTTWIRSVSGASTFRSDFGLLLLFAACIKIFMF